MPLKRLKTPHLFGGIRRVRIWWKETPDIFGVVTTQGREADLSKTRHFLVGDKARTRPVLKLAKRQDNLELSYLCSTFVLLMEWQERKTRARQGKARKSGVVTTPRHGKFTCCGIVNYHNQTAMKYHGKASQFTTSRCTTYNLELSYLCRTFVVLK